ncbi:outer membrane beta-barrel protein [Bosea sp. ANAM02]|uniref:outer membrane protein n=1 Tax=Bosea sp. ANAM02 TaxID=2020412 RepID=UPI00140F02AA|nr:outer membrane beta-barrel protein [Bosea sp. ANAM02]BCB22231.1 hypothetical protein OCUBac02_51250 [Bosea sp. ANAM02]
MLRKLILASASLLALAALSGTANAQSPYGFYVGAAGGGVSASAETSALHVPSFGSTDLGMKGFTGGGFAGFGITSSGIYTGIELSYDFANGEHSTVLPGVGLLSIGRDHTFGGAGRIGYAFDKETMVFGKVGYAYSHYTTKDLFAGLSEKKWQGGLKVGVGVEREIAANFALRLDYDADFASLKLPVSGINSDIVTQTGKVGLAYKF